MAEETEELKEAASGGLDEGKLAELLKQNQDASIAAMLAEMEKQRQSQQPTYQPPAAAQPAAEPDYFEQLVDQRSDAKFRQANFASAAAQDAAEFYSGEFWNETVEDWLVGETEEEQKAERKELRKKINDKFQQLAREGRPLPREDIANYFLMDGLKSNRSKLEAKITKKSQKVHESDLEKAKSRVDISAGAVIDFNPVELHKLTGEKIKEKFGSLQF
jgi:hypothetical protein